MINYNEDLQRNLINIFNFNKRDKEIANINNNVDSFNKILTKNISYITKEFVKNMSMNYLFEIFFRFSSCIGRPKI